MRSIRVRLIVGTALVMVLVFAISGIVLQTSVHNALLREFDTSLLAQTRGLASVVERRGSKIRMEYDPLQMPEFRPIKNPQYFQLWTSDGQSIATSPSLLNRKLEFSNPPGGQSVRFAVLPDGREGRILTLAFKPHVEDEDQRRGQSEVVVLAVARETESLEHTLTWFGGLLATVCIAATIVSASLLAWVIRNGLRPLGVLAARISDVGDGNLTDRIVLETPPTEISPVVSRLNELLARLEAAFTRERSFSADVAHELRTPLAGLQTTLEVGMSRQRSPSESAQLFSRSLLIAQQMHSMVETLLMLARVESHQVAIAQDEVDVNELLNECWAPLVTRAEKRGLVVSWEIEPQQVLRTDREKVWLVLQNVLENAVSYTNEGGSLRVTTSTDQDRLQIKFINSGSNVSADETDQVFERFWRGDTARSGAGTHCGLGLTLCKRLVEALRGSISVKSEKGGEFCVEITIPGIVAAPKLPVLTTSTR